MPTNPLLDLTPTQLQLIRGDRRTKLIGYLKTWEHSAAVLRYLEIWLGHQPDLATLRQARAETLLLLNRADAALHELDALDAERGATETRRKLRIDALIALHDWSAAEAVIAAGSDPATVERQRGDLLVAQNDFARAAAAYERAGIALHGPEATTLCAAELAAARGDWQQARTIMDARRAAHAEQAPSVNDLRLQQRIAAAQDEHATVEQITAELAEREATQRAQLADQLDLLDHNSAADVSDHEIDSLPEASAPTAPAEAPAAALELLRQHWGYEAFRGQQAAVVANVLAGRSTLAVLPTGAGKSLCYQLPAFLLDGVTIVVSPLIALMKDQIDNLPRALRGQAAAINSTMRGDEVAQTLQQMRAGRFKLVYVAPERLRQQAFVHALKDVGVARFVVDEAHCVSLWGLSFRPDYLFLKRVLQVLGEPPVLALTATATPETQGEIALQLGQLDVISASVYRANLHFSVVAVANSDAKAEALIALCKRSTGAVVVYARAREQCEKLAATLRRSGVKAAHYHAGIEDRAIVQERWMRGDVRVLVATIAFGMGVDKADVRMIVHYNVPQSVEAYYQEAGRAGRDGLPAECVLLFTANDKGQLVSWLRQDALDKDDLRAIYKVLRGHARSGFAALPMDALQAVLPNYNETQIRVVLGMLERVGLVVRHFDLPRAAGVTLLHAHDDPNFLDLIDAAGLVENMRRSVDLIQIAAACGWRPDELEARLLGWHSAGAISYNGTATDLLLQLLPAPSDTAAQIDRLLREYGARQDARIAAMVAYAKGLNCRHRALAAHFGQRLAQCGGPCDICAGSQSPIVAAIPQAARPSGPKLSGPAVAESILQTLRDLPFAVGRTGLAQIMVGSPTAPVGVDRCPTFGALAGYSRNAAIGLIDQLLDHQLLARDMSSDRPLVRLTDQGRRALQSPAALPDLAPAQPTLSDDDPLYAALAAWRTEKAKALNLPAYIIFSNATLRAIAAAQPQTPAELQQIKGVGAKTIAQHGDDVLALIAEHITAHEIEAISID